MSSAPARWDWLWAVLFPISLLLSMAALLLRFQIYSADRPESLALFAVLALIGAAAGLLMHHGGRVVRALVVGALLAVFLNHVFEWPLIGIRSRYQVPAAFLVGFALSWFLGRNLHVIGVAGGVAVLLATVTMPAESAISRTAQAVAEPSPRAGPPPVVHLIFDAHQGVETMPASIPGAAEMQGRLRAFYTDRGFRLFGHAFSRNSDTWNSLPDLLNFSIARQDGELISYGGGLEWILQRSEYFRRMAEFGYRIHVYQSDVLNFCTADVATCTTARFRSLNWIEDADVPASDKFRLLWTTFLGRSSIYAELAEVYNKAVAVLAARTDIKLSPVSTPENAPLPYTPLSVQAQVKLLAEDLKRLGPGDFVFAHLMIPHSPFALDAQCRLRGGPRTWQGATLEERYQLYLEQMICANSIVAELVASAGPAAHIVIHGDHGARLFETDDDHYGTLFAVRRPDQPAEYVRAQMAIDELLVRELLEPIGVPVPPLPVSGATIKRITAPQEPLRFDTYNNSVSTASGN